MKFYKTELSNFSFRSAISKTERVTISFQQKAWCLINSSEHTHTHTQPFNGPLAGTTWESRYQKGKTNLDFTEAKDSQWEWHQLGHMQVCTSLQTDNHASTPPLGAFVQMQK